MPRDSQGVYSLPSGTLVNTGDTIEVSQHNPPFLDVANALTNSLDRAGSGGMLAPLSMNSHPIRNVLPGENPNDVATKSQVDQSIAAGVPIGTVLDFAGTVIPLGYFLCDGKAWSRTQYAQLFAVIGTTWGAGDGSTTFNVPDFRGRTSAGLDNMGGTSANRLNLMPSTTLGGVGGAQEISLTVPQLPAHTHTVNDPGHSHGLGNQIGPVGSGIEAGSNYRIVNASTAIGQTGISLNNTGSGQAHHNVQPTAMVYKIIKASHQ